MGSPLRSMTGSGHFPQSWAIAMAISQPPGMTFQPEKGKMLTRQVAHLEVPLQKGRAKGQNELQPELLFASFSSDS